MCKGSYVGVVCSSIIRSYIGVTTSSTCKGSYVGVIESVHNLLPLLDCHRPVQPHTLVPIVGQIESCQERRERGEGKGEGREGEGREGSEEIELREEGCEG